MNESLNKFKTRLALVKYRLKYHLLLYWEEKPSMKLLSGG